MEGEFPTHILVPATKFTQAFPKIGYQGIGKVFDRDKVDYIKRTIVQATDLKEALDSLKPNKLANTLYSLNIDPMYPSVKYNLVEKEVNYFATKQKLID